MRNACPSGDRSSSDRSADQQSQQTYASSPTSKFINRRRQHVRSNKTQGTLVLLGIVVLKTDLQINSLESKLLLLK